MEDRALLAGDLVDINTSGPVPLTFQQHSVGDSLIYLDYESAIGFEPHVYNTVTQQTVVFDVTPGPERTFIRASATIGSKLFFVHLNTNGYQFNWIDVGNETPTLHTLGPASQLNVSGNLVAVGERLYFSAFDASYGSEIRWIDTTLEDPVLHTLDFGSSNPYGLSLLGTELHYFDTHGSNTYTWHWFDTTEVDPVLQQINVPVGRNSVPAHLTAVDTRLFFNADDPVVGRELFWLDRTEATPTVHTLDIYGGANSSDAGSGPAGLVLQGSKLFFNASTFSHGSELRWVDTNDPSLKLHTLDVSRGKLSSFGGLNDLIPFDGKLFFKSEQGVHWVEPAEDSPVVHDIAPSPEISLPSRLQLVGDQIYFVATDPTWGTEIRYVEATHPESGVHVVELFPGPVALNFGQVYGYSQSSPTFSVAGTTLFFNASIRDGYATLYSVDVAEPTPELTTITTLRGNASSDPGQAGGFATIGTTAFFNAFDPEHGAELRWVNADEPVDMFHTLDIFTGSQGSNPGKFGGYATRGRKLFFSAEDAEHGVELNWLTTGAGEPVLKTLDVNPGAQSSLAGKFGGFYRLGTRLYFTAFDRNVGYELRWIDMTQADPTINTIDVNPGKGSSFAGKVGGFYRVGAKLYFNAFVPSKGYELHWINWRDDNPIVRSLDVNPDGNSFAGSTGFVAAGNMLYFAADEATSGTELRYIDTRGNRPTLQTVDINPGAADSIPGHDGGLVQVGEKVYFDAFDSVHGYELRMIDVGDDPSGFTTFDIDPGKNSSFAGLYSGFVVADAKLFFTAAIKTPRSRSLYMIDTEDPNQEVKTIISSLSPEAEFGYAFSGTKLIFGRGWLETTDDDPVPHYFQNQPSDMFGPFTLVGDRLYYAGRSTTFGDELFSIEVDFIN